MYYYKVVCQASLKKKRFRIGEKGSLMYQVTVIAPIVVQRRSINILEKYFTISHVRDDHGDIYSHATAKCEICDDPMKWHRRNPVVTWEREN